MNVDNVQSAEESCEKLKRSPLNTEFSPPPPPPPTAPVSTEEMTDSNSNSAQARKQSEIEEHLEAENPIEDHNIRAYSPIEVFEYLFTGVEIEGTGLAGSDSDDEQADYVVPYQNPYSGWKRLDKEGKYQIHIKEIYSNKNNGKEERFVTTIDTLGNIEEFRYEIFQFAFPDYLAKYLEMEREKKLSRQMGHGETSDDSKKLIN